MKKLLLIVIIILFISSLSADWTRRFNIQNCTITGTDALHFEACVITGLFAGVITDEPHWALIAPMTIGFGKELVDWSRTGSFNAKDMMFNFGGSMLATAIYYVYHEKRDDRLKKESVIGLRKLMYDRQRRAGRMKSLGDKTFERTNFELINWNK